MIHAHILLIDADHRVLLSQLAAMGDITLWDVPAVAVSSTGDIEQNLVNYLQSDWHVTTTTKALFPLCFTTDKDAIHVLYGCRNWIGLQGLQRVQSMDDIPTQWVRVPRLSDHALSPALQALLPNIMTLLGTG